MFKIRFAMVRVTDKRTDLGYRYKCFAIKKDFEKYVNKNRSRIVKDFVRIHKTNDCDDFTTINEALEMEWFL